MNGLNEFFAPLLATLLGLGFSADALRRMFKAEGEGLLRNIWLSGEFGFFVGFVAWGLSELLERTLQ